MTWLEVLALAQSVLTGEDEEKPAATKQVDMRTAGGKVIVDEGCVVDVDPPLSTCPRSVKRAYDGVEKDDAHSLLLTKSQVAEVVKECVAEVEEHVCAGFVKESVGESVNDEAAQEEDVGQEEEAKNSEYTEYADDTTYFNDAPDDTEEAESVRSPFSSFDIQDVKNLSSLHNNVSSQKNITLHKEVSRIWSWSGKWRRPKAGILGGKRAF